MDDELSKMKKEAKERIIKERERVEEQIVRRVLEENRNLIEYAKSDEFRGYKTSIIKLNTLLMYTREE